MKSKTKILFSESLHPSLVICIIGDSYDGSSSEGRVCQVMIGFFSVPLPFQNAQSSASYRGTSHCLRRKHSSKDDECHFLLLGAFLKIPSWIRSAVINVREVLTSKTSSKHILVRW